jgi:hypothetical protein
MGAREHDGDVTTGLLTCGALVVPELPRLGRNFLACSGLVQVDPMSSYHVCFDGKWQERFRHREEALAWAQAAGETGRIVHVARAGLLRFKLIACFPESQAEEAQRLWDVRMAGQRASANAYLVGPGL